MAETVMGEIEEERKNYSESLSHYQKALTLETSDLQRAGAYEAMAGVYKKWGQFGFADQCFKYSLSLAPKSAWGHHNYAIFLVDQKRMDEAMKESETSLELSSFGAAHSLLSEIYFEQGWKIIQSSPEPGSEAESLFNKSVEQNPRNARSYYGLAEYYFEHAMKHPSAEEQQKVKENLIHALELEPNFKDAARLLADSQMMFSKPPGTFIEVPRSAIAASNSPGPATQSRQPSTATVPGGMMPVPADGRIPVPENFGN